MTKLGWTLSGPLPKRDLAQVAATCHVAAEDDGLGAQVKTWFSMESYTTRENVSGCSKDDKRVLEQLEKLTKLVDGRYEVGLHWAEENATIQNNHCSAHLQFCSLERRLKKDESLKQRYEETMDVDNFYTDVFAKSVAFVEEAIEVYKDVRTTLKLGGFILLKWICNNDLVNGSIPQQDRSEVKNKTFEAEP